uniref:CCHC-type domain-containing protein n=1 Tax=Meloidogyne incognita TaxID=6306 RepID=A0A914MJW7_MELIC
MSKQQNYEPLSPAPMDTDESIIDFDSRELLAMASGEYISILETLDEDALLAEDMEVEDQIDAALEQIEETLSADAMQGHETDLAIVVTTATQRNESGADKSVEFWADPARANVALSRGKHGLIIIVVADSIQYCNAMQNTEAQYIRGTLHVNGRTVQDYNFYAGSAKSYNLNQYYPSNSDRPRRAEKREWAPSNCNRCGKRGHTERECRN